MTETLPAQRRLHPVAAAGLRIGLTTVLYAAAGLSGFYALGYAISDPLPGVGHEEFRSMFFLCLAGSLTLAWAASALWVSWFVDGLARLVAQGRRAPAGVLLLLALACCAPLVWRVTFGELRDLWEMGLATTLAPPALLIAIGRLLRPSLRSAPTPPAVRSTP